jgi:hypothetical protein
VGGSGPPDVPESGVSEPEPESRLAGVPDAPAANQPAAPQTNVMARASFALGILSIPFYWLLFPPVLAILFAWKGFALAKQGAPNEGLAAWGFMLGIVGIGLLLVVAGSIGNGL